jgi:hypothetical protein
MSFKKALFPFFNKDQHQFLTQKWWFRLIIILYVIAFIILPLALWNSYYESAAGWCFDSLYLFSLEDYGWYQSRIEECMQFARDARLPGSLTSIFGALTIHYIIQLIFFKIVINYIVLGGKRDAKGMALE